jgi:CheY-like chemotaxis protein
MPRILHIEDDSANRLLVRKLLSSSGFDVIDAVDGLDGIRKACSESPDLVLVDIAIPGLDGYEVTLRLRSEPSLRNVPIVAITAEGNRDTSLSVGCDGYLQKPIDARSFADTIQTYLGGRREQTSPDRARKHLRQQGQRIVSHLENKIAELESANARLLDMDRARKEFYRNVTHELSTPMTPIVGYLKLLRDGDLGAIVPSQEKALRAMDECVQRLRGLIDNLLDVTGLETGSKPSSVGVQACSSGDADSFSMYRALVSRVGATRSGWLAQLIISSTTQSSSPRQVERLVFAFGVSQPAISNCALSIQAPGSTPKLWSIYSSRSSKAMVRPPAFTAVRGWAWPLFRGSH